MSLTAYVTKLPIKRENISRKGKDYGGHVPFMDIKKGKST
jgi:hypothetical protein